MQERAGEKLPFLALDPAQLVIAVDQSLVHFAAAIGTIHGITPLICVLWVLFYHKNGHFQS